MKTRLVPFALALCCLFSTVGAAAAERHVVTGIVTGVADGDTFYLGGQSSRMRLAQIDSPEKEQPYGRRAEQSLRDLIGKRQVTVEWSEKDIHGRPVVQVWVNGIDVNAEQVRRGYAWAYPQYVTDPKLYTIEAEARAAKRGLWADPHPVAPWDWRKRERRKRER